MFQTIEDPTVVGLIIHIDADEDNHPFNGRLYFH